MPTATVRSSMLSMLAVLALAAFCSSDAALAETGICDEADITVTGTPAPPQNAANLRRFRQQAAELKEGGDVVLIGDSLVQAWPPGSENSVLGWRVLNLGMAGDKTQHVLWRIANTDLSGTRPEYAVLLVGTNNLADKPCAIVSGVGKVVDAVRSAWPSVKILVIEIPPRGKAFATFDSERRSANEGIRALAEEKSSVRTLNVDEAITCGGVVDCANYQQDRLHFTDRGYAVLRREVARSLG
jgi:lysophospholipase L1-like esterase